MLKPLLAALVLAAAIPMTASAEAAAQKPFVSVTGEGSVSVPPDIAIVTSGVVTRAPAAGAALKANATAMTKVFGVLKDAKIEERDYGTSGLTVQPQYDYSDNNNGQKPPRLVGYEVRNTIEIRARDVNKLGELVDALVASGSNEIQGLAFDVSDKEAKLDEARKAAIADARRKAEIYAKETGMKLGEPLAIDETDIPSEPVMDRFAARAKVAAAPATPIARGEQELRARVSIRWSLEH